MKVFRFILESVGMRKTLLLLCLVSQNVNASLGDDLNSLIDKFFGTPALEVEETKPLIETTVPSSREVEIDKDVDEIRTEILNEESKLAEFEQKIFDTENEIWAEKSKQTTLEHELFLLDSSISNATTKLDNLVNNEKKWQEMLDKLTREKSDINAKIRVFDREYQEFLSKKFIQKENLGGGENLSIIKWLFSELSVGEILSEARTQNLIKKQKAVKLDLLKSAKNELEKNETNAAKIFAKINNLKNQILEEKAVFDEIASAKANIIERSKFTVEERERALEEFREQQNQSTFFLQNLRATLSDEDLKVIKTFQKTENRPFDFPLKIPQKITASFHDDEYENTFGRVHNGVDFFAPHGTPIFAPADGTVVKVASNGFGYSYFILKHDNGFFTVYGHVSQILVAKDDIVKRDEMIGRTGGTPGARGAGYFTSGPHLHLEVFRGGEFLDPMEFMK